MYKIAVIGPESTGKSALTQALAQYYNSPYVDEYAREYVGNLGRPYNFEDVCNIAHVQISAENYFIGLQQEGLFKKNTEYFEGKGVGTTGNLHVPESVITPNGQGVGTTGNQHVPESVVLPVTADATSGVYPYVFFDTELIITKVWFEYCFKKTPSFLTEQLNKGFFDLYLLCNTDLPWEPDSVREHGDDREFFLEWYRREIEQLGKPWINIQGTGECRLKNAQEALQKWTITI